MPKKQKQKKLIRENSKEYRWARCQLLAKILYHSTLPLHEIETHIEQAENI